MNNVGRALIVVFASATAARAQGFGGFSGSPFSTASGSTSGASASSSSGSGSDSGFGSGGSDPDSGPEFSGFAGPGFDFDEAARVRVIHGVLGAIAMAVLFPGGAILVRVLPGRLALWAHAVMQVMALCVFVGAVGLGIHLVQEVRDLGLNLFTDPGTRYHPILGLVVMVCLLVQPLLGLLHHEKFKYLGKRQIWSYLHIFNGRIAITLGIVNGALGLWMAKASDKLKVVYVAAAATIWVIWVLTACWGEWHRWVRGRDARKSREGQTSF